MKGYVHSLESFGSVDGPGIRFVVFLTGCPMRCQFCHNPDTWDITSGEEYDIDTLLNKVMRYKAYWGKDGGITVSGGEPLVQIDFVTEFFKRAKAKGVNTCLDTSAQPFSRDPEYLAKFDELMKYTDLVMLDIKQIDDELHKALTGHTNANILDCARYLSEINKPVWIRHVLVPGGEAASDNDELLNRLSDFIKTLNNVKKVEVLPYHVFGVHKWEILGIPYKLDGVNPPSTERVENAKKILGV